MVFRTSWIADYPDAATFLYSLFHSDSTYNDVLYDDPEFDVIMDQAIGEHDPAARYALYRQAERLMLENGSIVPSYHANSTGYLVNPRVTWPLSPMPIPRYSFARIAD